MPLTVARAVRPAVTELEESVHDIEEKDQYMSHGVDDESEMEEAARTFFVSVTHSTFPQQPQDREMSVRTFHTEVGCQVVE